MNGCQIQVSPSVLSKRQHSFISPASLVTTSSSLTALSLLFTEIVPVHSSHSAPKPFLVFLCHMSEWNAKSSGRNCKHPPPLLYIAKCIHPPPTPYSWSPLPWPELPLSYTYHLKHCVIYLFIMLIAYFSLLPPTIALAWLEPLDLRNLCLLPTGQEQLRTLLSTHCSRPDPICWYNGPVSLATLWHPWRQGPCFIVLCQSTIQNNFWYKWKGIAEYLWN